MRSQASEPHGHSLTLEEYPMAERFFEGEEAPMAEITLAKALKIKNRLTGRLAKVQTDIQAYNSIPEGQAGQVNVPALMQTRDELVGALVGLKTALNEANREAQRDIYDLAEKKATAQFLAGVNTRHGPQPAVYPNTTEVSYVAALKKADVDGLVAGGGEGDRPVAGPARPVQPRPQDRGRRSHPRTGLVNHTAGSWVR